jgi:RHS repeat-associated protein
VLVEQAATVTQEGSHRVVTWNYQPGSFTPLTQQEHIELNDFSQEEMDQRFYAIVTDLVGTPAELTDPDGELVGRQLRTIWGGTIGSGAQTPLRFPGQYADPETGLYYNQQRYYDPVSGSYLTPDPLGLAPSANPHAYVSNPEVLTDPLGLMSCKSGIPTSRNQMQDQIDRKKAPEGVKRVDPPYPGINDAQPHVHFTNGRSTLNWDGTWGHGDGGDVKLTNNIIRWLRDNGWGVPGDKGS